MWSLLTIKGLNKKGIATIHKMPTTNENFTILKYSNTKTDIQHIRQTIIHVENKIKYPKLSNLNIWTIIK